MTTRPYRFKGGPAEGEIRNVYATETEWGWRPLDYVNVVPQMIRPAAPFDSAAPVEDALPVHTYRFVCTGRPWEGFYRWAPPS